MANGENKKPQKETDYGHHKRRICEWNECQNEGRYRIQTSAMQNDIHWFCHVHVKVFDLSGGSQQTFLGTSYSSWTEKQKKNKNNNLGGFENDVQLRHLSSGSVMKYTNEDLKNLKTLGLRSGAKPDDIKKAYKRLVKHCHPDQNPELKQASLIFNIVTDAFNALKDKDFK